MSYFETIERLTWQRLLRHLRKVHDKRHPPRSPDVFDLQGQEANARIRQLLESPDPCMIARFGNNELRTIENFLAIQEQGALLLNLRRYLTGETGPWWWDDRTAREMKLGAGFFPVTPMNLERFSRLSIEDASQIDVLGSWLLAESRLGERLKAVRVPLRDLEPYFHTDPWSEALQGRRVLVIHPFETSIRSQYAKRRELFQNPKVLPDFELMTFPSVQTIGGTSSRFHDWFEALDDMKRGIAALSFDIAIIGAGAYGMPLAAFIKRDLRRKAVHLGGATQILFGIRGKRWDGMAEYSQDLYNEHWARPLAIETPEAAVKIEGGCYW
jgi:hypothetical protein